MRGGNKIASGMHSNECIPLFVYIYNMYSEASSYFTTSFFFTFHDLPMVFSSPSCQRFWV